MKRFLYNHVFPYLAWAIAHIWCRTLRVKNKNPQEENYFKYLPGRYILSLWHGRIFYLFFYFRNRPDLHLLISPSQDGDFLARLARLMGYSVIRGSTYKQAVASARKLIKVLKQDQRIIVIADGSRGPARIAQPGSLEIAGITAAPLIPMTYGARSRRHLRSWDRFLIPLPFTRCTLHFGPPIVLATRPDKNTLEEKRRQLENTLNALTDAADAPQ